jgi:hypothetical protein
MGNLRLGRLVAGAFEITDHHYPIYYRHVINEPFDLGSIVQRDLESVFRSIDQRLTRGRVLVGFRPMEINQEEPHVEHTIKVRQKLITNTMLYRPRANETGKQGGQRVVYPILGSGDKVVMMAVTGMTKAFKDAVDE